MARRRRGRGYADDSSEKKTPDSKEKEGEAKGYEKAEKVVETPEEIKNSDLEEPKLGRRVFALAGGIGLVIILTLVLRGLGRDKQDEYAAQVRYVVNPSEIPKDGKVLRAEYAWNPAGEFYLTSSFELQEGDYILEKSNGLIHWTSDPIAEKRGYEQVTPEGVDWTPEELRSKDRAKMHLAKQASIACLMGVVGPKPEYDDKTGVPLVKGGSRHFGMRNRCALQVTKLPKGANYLSMAVNDVWTTSEMANNVGVWYIEVQVIRPKG